MTYCPNCGAAVEGAFCGACGKPVGSASSAAAGAAASGLQDNMAGTLCYLLGVITGVIFLVLEPYNRKREIRFHAFQSIFLCLALFAIYVVLTVLGSVIPFIGGILLGLVSLVVWLGSIVVWLLLMFRTYQGKKWVLPVIGPLAEKQAG